MQDSVFKVKPQEKLMYAGCNIVYSLFPIADPHFERFNDTEAAERHRPQVRLHCHYPTSRHWGGWGDVGIKLILTKVIGMSCESIKRLPQSLQS